MKRIFLLCALVMTGLAQAVPATSVEIAAQPEASVAKAFADAVFKREALAASGDLTPAARSRLSPELVNQLYALLPEGDPLRGEFIGWNAMVLKNLSGTTSYVDVTMEYEFPDNRWLVFATRITPADTGLKVDAFNVTPTTGSQASLNAFTFEGKDAKHFSFLALTVLAFGFSIYAFVVCLRTRGIRRKWLWLASTLIGMMTFSMNWSDGSIRFLPLHFQLFSSGYQRLGLVGPWCVSVSVPVGALYFMLRRRRLPVDVANKSSVPPALPTGEKSE